MGITDRLPEDIISGMKHARDNFHIETGIRRLGASNALSPETDPSKLVVVVNGGFIDPSDPSGGKKTRLELPGGGISFVWASLHRVFTSPDEPFRPLLLAPFLKTSKKELKQETGIEPDDVVYTGETFYSFGNEAGPDHVIITRAFAPIDVILPANNRTVSNEVSSVELLSKEDICGHIAHHALTKAFEYIEQEDCLQYVD